MITLFTLAQAMSRRTCSISYRFTLILCFIPLLTEETFKREGHHLEPADPNRPTGDLKINGIVYNEVKSAGPEDYLDMIVRKGLLPDTCYAYNGGGDPQAIPDLTYEQLKTYYRTYYHPSNCYFFCYGNIPTSDYLEFLSDKLAALPRTETNGSPHPLRSEVTHPSRWESPRDCERCLSHWTR